LQAWLPNAALAWNFPSWSLSNEAFFYAIYLRVLKAFQDRSRGWLMGAVAFLWAIGQIPPLIRGLLRLEGALWSNLVSYFPLFRLPEFLIGVAVGVLFMRDPGINVARRATTFSLIGAASSLVVAFGVSGLPTLLTDSKAFLGPAFALLTYGLALGAGPLNRALRHPVSVTLGDASYAMYLLHVPVARLSLTVATRAGIDDPLRSWGFLLLVTVVVIMVALPIHRYFEKPARRIVGNWGKSLELRSTEPAPQVE
ncbi:MAG: acyltransferase, partial [Acidimicrobiia bacterium]|nr:acyltransferase [Acidimicrobiia bacterium]